jgi:hypothetical protein
VTGSLPSFYLKQVVQALILRIEGVKRVDNRVAVRDTRDVQLASSTP